MRSRLTASLVICLSAACPFCNRKVIDTLAKVINVTTFWRCKLCDGTWTIASLAASQAR
jgi:ribosomal protein L37AE/L43A